MKKILLISAIIFSINSFAQTPDPNLFQTWYLSSVQLSDGTPFPYEVSEIDPKITPTLTISPSLEISGNGACNTFTGKFTTDLYNSLQATEFLNSTQDCTTQVHNSFEQDYFNFLKYGAGYEISQVSGGLHLSMVNNMFGGADFYNFPLNTKTFTIDQVELYPNPCSAKVFIQNLKSTINKVEIYNSFGQNCKSIYENFEAIDISEFSSGVYIVKIFDENGAVSKKIVKE